MNWRDLDRAPQIGNAIWRDGDELPSLLTRGAQELDIVAAANVFIQKDLAIFPFHDALVSERVRRTWTETEDRVCPAEGSIKIWWRACPNATPVASCWAIRRRTGRGRRIADPAPLTPTPSRPPGFRRSKALPQPPSMTVDQVPGEPMAWGPWTRHRATGFRARPSQALSLGGLGCADRRGASAR